MLDSESHRNKNYAKESKKITRSALTMQYQTENANFSIKRLKLQRQSRCERIF